MPRHAFKMLLHPGQAEEYQRRHAALWPEIKTLLADAGVTNYSTYHDPETNILFAYLERPENHRMDELPQHPAMQRWWAFMKDIMAANPDNSPVMAPLVEVFHMD
jgi:L-rhamnose mutarotase